MKQNVCKYCGSHDHYSIMCFSRPRRPLKKESDKTHDERTKVNRLWFELNPPNSKGVWFCYLQISPECPKKVTRSTIRLEHVKPKVRYPELKFEVTNLRPSCDACNKVKGSLEIHELAKIWPHLKYLVV